MKGAGPQGQALLLEIASLRPPNQKRSDLFNPFPIPSASQLSQPTAQFLFRREALCFPFLVAPSRWISMSLKRRSKTSKVSCKRLISEKSLFSLDT
jgi:hypothetical protein